MKDRDREDDRDRTDRDRDYDRENGANGDDRKGTSTSIRTSAPILVTVQRPDLAAQIGMNLYQRKTISTQLSKARPLDA